MSSIKYLGDVWYIHLKTENYYLKMCMKICINKKCVKIHINIKIKNNYLKICTKYFLKF